MKTGVGNDTWRLLKSERWPVKVLDALNGAKVLFVLISTISMVASSTWMTKSWSSPLVGDLEPPFAALEVAVAEKSSFELRRKARPMTSATAFAS
jgi:hypothetical protein